MEDGDGLRPSWDSASLYIHTEIQQHEEQLRTDPPESRLLRYGFI
jgi:hypothetical protein